MSKRSEILDKYQWFHFHIPMDLGIGDYFLSIWIVDKIQEKLWHFRNQGVLNLNYNLI